MPILSFAIPSGRTAPSITRLRSSMSPCMSAGKRRRDNWDTEFESEKFRFSDRGSQVFTCTSLVDGPRTETGESLKYQGVLPQNEDRST